MLHESLEMLMSYKSLPPPTRARLFLHDLPYQTDLSPISKDISFTDRIFIQVLHLDLVTFHDGQGYYIS